MPPEIALFCENLLFLEQDDIGSWVSTKATLQFHPVFRKSHINSLNAIPAVLINWI